MRDWETNEEYYDINVEYYLDDEDEIRQADFAVCSYPNDSSIREATTERLLDMHSQANKVTITHLEIL